MQRYFFEIASKEEVFSDPEGLELTDEVAAHEYALHLISKIMRYDPDQRDWRGWRIDGVDSRKGRVLSVLYPHARPGLRRTFAKRRINL